MKAILIWIKDAFIESLNQTWTLLGMFIAWCVLEGSAKTVVGYAITLALAVWLLTIKLRGPLDLEIVHKDEDEDEEAPK
jgi:hypothetical protein